MGADEWPDLETEAQAGGDIDGRPVSQEAPLSTVASSRLAVLKALGDNTRYAIYLELARSQSPRSTADIAETLTLHPNTVRPHLERMRDVGLLDVEIDGRGTVGRPQHRYSLAADAPSLGLEPPAFPLLARLLAQVAAQAGVEPGDAALAALDQGRDLAARRPRAGCVAALTAALDELGFDPAVAGDGQMVTIAFTHCPYRELAEIHPELVCNLHRGLIEGFVEEIGGAGVERFGTLADRDPCQVELSVR
ncbi:MAG: helix-turn-helix transcriptional regulator [Acidimicrobiales bacterium]|nr:helix-turn-helix domain-containing protein [Actinomycetota bacterium]